MPYIIAIFFPDSYHLVNYLLAALDSYGSTLKTRKSPKENKGDMFWTMLRNSKPCTFPSTS